AAGLHKLTPEDKRDIDQLNKRYKEKFGFPFVICARENKANAILLGLKRRLDNSKESELEEGIQEVKKIFLIYMWSIEQSSWLEIQRSLVRPPALPDFSVKRWVWNKIKLGLMTTNESLREWKSSDSGIEN
ncbi:unnamed protein product, partial [Timema podura]|nr:unnamed protein product [Timema podura]